MSVVLPPPPPVKSAVTILVFVAVLSLASGVFTSLCMAAVALFDPVLGGDLSLPLALLGAGLMVTLVGSAMPIVAAASLREARPAGRPLLMVVGGGLCLTPLLPLGAWMVYVAYGHAEVDAWYGALEAR